LRSRWRSWIGLALIIGFAAGAAMTLAQAARRSEQAYRAFSERMNAVDVVMTGASPFGLVGGVDLDAVTRSGFVAASARAFVALPFSGRTDDGKVLDATTVFPLASVDERLGSTVERWKMLDGRRADPESETEAVASFVLADRLGLHVGSTLDIRFYDAQAFLKTAVELLAGLAPRIGTRDRVTSPPDYADGPRVRLRVVGIEASPAEFPPLLNELAPVLHLTPAFEERYSREIVGSPVGFVTLQPGRSIESFGLEVERLAAGKPVSFVSQRALQAPKVERSIHAEVVALALVAALVGLAGLVGVGQAMTRQTLAESEQLSTLRSLGMQSRQLRWIAVIRLLGIGMLGAAIACVVASFVSQYALLPLARKAELDPGVHIDLTVLAVGAAVIVVLSLGIALWSSWVALRARPVGRADARTRRPGRIASIGAIGALPLSFTFGVRHALQRARRAVPSWVTMLALGLTVAVLAGTLVFTSNLRRLLDEPARYGWNWDAKVGAPGLPDFHAFIAPTLARDPNVAALSSGTITQIDVDSLDRIDVLAIDRIKGEALPTMLRGRAPIAPNEIALGAHTMRKLGVDIGRSVEARIGNRSEPLRVVGQSVLPEVGDAGQLGTGSLMTFAGLQRLLPTAPDNSFFVRFRDDPAVDGRRLATAVEPVPTHFQARPEDLVDLARGGGLLFALVAFLALLGFILLAHALVTSVRARRRELAVLRSVGVARRQIAGIVLWQSLTLTVGALVVGIGLGGVLGRLAWQAFAHDQGVATDTVLPMFVFLAISVGALGVAVAAAFFPAVVAARSHPTRVLRSE
jgi:ABC-type lipoprotein release transport system permease subunit